MTGNSIFESPGKAACRAAIAASCAPGSTLAYLDDETAGATLYFQNALAKTDVKLVPVNWHHTACESIFEATGVRAVHADFKDVDFSSVAAGGHLVIWFDAMRNDIAESFFAKLKGLDVAALALTVSNRGLSLEERTTKAKLYSDVLHALHFGGIMQTMYQSAGGSVMTFVMGSRLADGAVDKYVDDAMLMQAGIWLQVPVVVFRDREAWEHEYYQANGCFFAKVMKRYYKKGFVVRFMKANCELGKEDAWIPSESDIQRYQCKGKYV